MLSSVRLTAPVAQEEEAVRRLRCDIVSECWDLWRLWVKTRSTRTFVIKESSTSSWVHLIETFTLLFYLLNLFNTDTCCVFSGILMQMEASPDEEDVVTLEIKSDIQLILSVLCENDMHRKVKPGKSTLYLTCWTTAVIVRQLKSSLT